MRSPLLLALSVVLSACAAPKDASRSGADSARPAGAGETTGVSARPEPMPAATGARDSTTRMPAAKSGSGKSPARMPNASRDSVSPPSRSDSNSDTAARAGGAARGPKPPSRVIPDPVVRTPVLRDSASRTPRP